MIANCMVNIFAKSKWPRNVQFSLLCTTSTYSLFMKQYIYIFMCWDIIVCSFFLNDISMYIIYIYKRLNVLVGTKVFILSFLPLCSVLVYYRYANIGSWWVATWQKYLYNQSCQKEKTALRNGIIHLSMTVNELIEIKGMKASSVHVDRANMYPVSMTIPFLYSSGIRDCSSWSYIL